jgi:antitoxin component HigA of HigAB toxin-antitoxin module
MNAPIIHGDRNAQVQARVIPRAICPKREHRRALAKAEKLMGKGEMRTADEDTAVDLVVQLITAYEEERYPLPHFTARV